MIEFKRKKKYIQQNKVTKIRAEEQGKKYHRAELRYIIMQREVEGI